MKHVIAHMKGNGGGVGVNVFSTLGAYLRIPNAAAYITSKAPDGQGLSGCVNADGQRRDTNVCGGPPADRLSPPSRP